MRFRIVIAHTWILAVFGLSACSSGGSINSNFSENPDPQKLSIAADHFVLGCINPLKSNSSQSQSDVFKSLGYKTQREDNFSIRRRNNIASVNIGKFGQTKGSCTLKPNKSRFDILLKIAEPKIIASLGSKAKIRGNNFYNIPNTSWFAGIAGIRQGGILNVVKISGL